MPSRCSSSMQMPELEKNARQRYESQRDWLMQQYEQVSDREQEEYKR